MKEHTTCIVCGNRLHRDDAEYPTGWLDHPHCRRCAKKVADEMEMARNGFQAVAA